MNTQARAILWAQFRSLLNFGRRSGAGIAFTAVLFTFWYGIFTALAVLAARLMSDPESVPILIKHFPAILFGILLYWQIVPVMMAATGYALEVRKLIVYPIPHRRLFGIDLLLRALTSLEMFILLTGGAIGAAMNPRLPNWGLLGFAFFAAFNLFLAAGVKEVLTRALARRRFRELFMFVFVLICALPQLVVVTGSADRVSRWFGVITAPVLPWSAAASVIQGNQTLIALASMMAWVAAAYVFGRNQFERTLRFDADAARSSSASTPSRGAGAMERVFRLPAVLFRDPLAALIEKELRFLSRAPRFRLVFAMGFSFGLLIWIPMMLRNQGGFMARNFLVVVSSYAVLMLADVCFWNTFGFDRGAAQIYLAAPVRFQTVLIAKNITAFIFILLEMVAISLVCAAIRLPVSPQRILEAASVTAVLSVYLMALGNLTSTHSPRAVNPQKVTRSGAAAKSQFLLMFLFPVAAIPIALAYVARWAFRSEPAFFVTLLVTGAVGAVVYRVALDSAVDTVRDRREQFVTALSQGEGPIG
jgi:ABC-2 type transport system permease protein